MKKPQETNCIGRLIVRLSTLTSTFTTLLWLAGLGGLAVTARADVIFNEDFDGGYTGAFGTAQYFGGSPTNYGNTVVASGGNPNGAWKEYMTTTTWGDYYAGQVQLMTVSGNADPNPSDYILSFDAYGSQASNIQLGLQSWQNSYFGGAETINATLDLGLSAANTWQTFTINLGTVAGAVPTGATWQFNFQLNSWQWGGPGMTDTLVVDNITLVHVPQVTGCPETNGVKFIALPQINGGFDVKDSRSSIVLADDFFCDTPGQITDIHIWGSWSNDYHTTMSITNFWLGIYDDVPAGTNSTGFWVPSHPGTNLLWQQSFLPGQFWETYWTNGNEAFFDPISQSFGEDSQVWYYCFYPANPFVQQGSSIHPTNYWLAARAQLDPNDGTVFGWKTSFCNYNDPAVWGTVGTNGLPKGNWQSLTNPVPLNLAFKLTSAVHPIPCVETNGAKYDQEPNLGYGQDVWNSSAQPPQVTDGPWWLADDFVCTNSGSITDIHLWGSWQNDSPLSNSITFQLYVLDDVPTNSFNPFSHPGTNVLWHQAYPPGTYAETIWSSAYEYFIDPGLPGVWLGQDFTAWYYCFNATNLHQFGTASQPSNYWLVAFAELPRCVTNVFGWKTTTNLQHDVSVRAPWGGYNVPPPNYAWQPNTNLFNQPFDLAFKLTTQTNQCPLPVIQCSNQVIECGTPWTITNPPVLDLCCPTPLNPVTLAAAPITNGTACSNVITLVWKYTDCTNRTVYGTNTVTVHDTTPPILYCTNLVLACGDQSYTNPPGAYDTCCGSNVTVTFLYSYPLNTNCGRTIMQTWQATDCCSNVAQCSRMVNIVAGLGHNLVVPNSNANVEGNSGNTYPFDIGATTQRYQQVYDSSQFDAVPPGGAYITAISFRMDAGFGAFSATLPSVQIDLSTTPSAPDGLSTTFANNVGPDDRTVYSGALPLSSAAIGSPAAFDIMIPLTTPFWYDPLGGDLLLDVRNFAGGSSQHFDAVSTAGDSVSRVYGPVSSSTGATDTLGLVTEFTLGVGTVNLACSNLTLMCGSPIPTNPPAVLDACCSNVTVTFIGSNVVYGPCVQTIYQQWQAVDCCGYITNCTRAIQLTDTNPPVMVGCITGMTYSCTAGWSFDTPTAKYFCTGSNAFVGASLPITNLLSACSQTVTRTWTATNQCSGAIASCTEVITVLDTNAPVISGCVTGKTVQCGSNWVFDTPTAHYLCSGSNVFVGVLGTVTVGSNACNVQTRTWAATNACSGAIATCAEVVTVVDSIPPAITCPTNKTINISSGSAWSFDAPTYSDACCTNLSLTFHDVTNNPCPLTVTRTWVVTSCCNLSNGCSQTITVVYTNTPPPGINTVKYVQWPNTNGYDVYDKTIIFLADDFPCTNTGPISDIHIWCSYSADWFTNPPMWLGIWSDVPAAGITNSHPGLLLWQQYFATNQYESYFWSCGAEEFYMPYGNSFYLPDSQAFYYVFYPTNAFVQQGTPAHPTNYWLSVYCTDLTSFFGWKTSTNAYGDAAVWAFAPPSSTNTWTAMRDPMTQGPLNMAFKITTAAIPPIITNIVVVSPNVTLWWTSVPGRTYRVLTSGNVQTPLASWVMVGSDTLAISGITSTTVPIGGSRQFYRIQLLPGSP